MPTRVTHHVMNELYQFVRFIAITRVGTL